MHRTRTDRRDSSEPPETDLLKVDKDITVGRDWINDYVLVIIVVCQLFGIRVKTIKMCRSARKGQHFYIQIAPPIKAALANRIQYMVGDDCLRVNFNQARIESGLVGWSKLFEVPNDRLRTVYPSVPVAAATRKLLQRRCNR